MTSKTTVTLYGIKNCDTVKKATKWLLANEISYEFHDFKTAGLSGELLSQFCESLPWETLINKRSTTYRQLPDDIKANITDHTTAFNAVIAQPTLLKRPLTLANQQLHVGFKDTTYQEIFS